eukprot:COSAG02_NODE_520_length_20751_cov_17.817112_7_plen_83_part_00
MEIIKEHRCANTWRKWSDLSADDPDGMCLSIFGCHFRSVNQMETILEDRCPHPPQRCLALQRNCGTDGIRDTDWALRVQCQN